MRKRSLYEVRCEGTEGATALIVTEPSMQVAPVALAQFVGQYQSNFGTMFAGATIVSLIPAVILLSLQPYFVRSVSSQGLKE